MSTPITMNMESSNCIYTVREVIQETEHVVTLRLSCNEDIQAFIPGQFITIFLPETKHNEGKSYSVSSAPHEGLLAITVKEIGMFSRALCSKKVGDTLQGTRPYGYFYTESTTSSLIIIAAGIGIAPFRSMIVDTLHTSLEREVTLFYVNKTSKSIIFKEELDQLSKTSHGRLKVVYYLTQESGVEGMQDGRIPVSVPVQTATMCASPEFFICGSIAFVRDYWRGLREQGISEEVIYTESFF